MTAPVFDLSFLQENPPTAHMSTGEPRFRIRAGKVVRRDPKTITGIVIHQTACVFGVTDLWRRRAARVHRAGITGFDPEDTAHHLRALRSSVAHIFAMNCGHIIQVCPLDWYDNSANGLNATTVSLEVEGRFPGIMGRPRKGTMSGDLLFAAMNALNHIVETGCGAGMPLQYIYAHRQSNKNRRSDPGEEIWRRIVTGYAVQMLGLETLPGFTCTGGKAIPEEWDENGEGAF